MKIQFGRTGIMDVAEVREINTLEDLIALAGAEGHELIIGKPWTWQEEFADCQISVEVYDGYRE